MELSDPISKDMEDQNADKPELKNSDLKTEPVVDEYLNSMEDLSPAADRGILKKIIKEGSCDIKPCRGDTVIVHYVGTYYGGEEHGKVFDSSRERNERFEFVIGKGDVIKAWDVGVATMKLGEVCELVVAPDYGYMDGKTMKFEIELFETNGKDVSLENNGSIRKSQIKEGRDTFNPIVGAEATIIFRCLPDGEKHEVSYCVGCPTPEIPNAIDLAVRHMNTGEVAQVTVNNSLTGCTISSGDVSSDLTIYELTLKSFEKTKHLSSISTFPEQMQYAEMLKNKANNFLKDSKIDFAIELYKRLDDDLQYVIANGAEEKKQLSEMTTAVRLNLALSYLKLNNPGCCIDYCKKVLDVSANNEKALFRIGQAYLLRKDHEEAIVYFNKIVKSNPGNTAAVQQLQLCNQVIKKAKEFERKVYRSIFERYKETGLGDTNVQEELPVSNAEKTAS